MGLRIICGRADSGKSRMCLEEINSYLKAGWDHSLVLVVPEQFSFQAERNLIRTTGKGGIIRAEVLSFRRMAYRVFNEVGGITRHHMDPAGKSILICSIIEDIAQKLSVFSGGISTGGFVKTISDMISEFKRYGVIPEDFEKAAQSMDGAEVLKYKLKDMALIYREFEDRLHKKHMDFDDDLNELVAGLDKSRYFENAQIWFDEFSGFTPQEYKIIEKLLVKSRMVTVTLCMDCPENEKTVDESGVFLPSNITYNKLLKMAVKKGIEVKTCAAVTGSIPDSSGELKHLESNYFNFPRKVYEKQTEKLHIFRASNLFSEVEEAARDIVRLCRDNGLRYRDIAVVSRIPETYENLIQVVFKQYGIPYFLDKKKQVISHPIVVLILSALEIFLENWSYRSVFRYLKTGLTDLEAEDVDILENYVLACGIKGIRWTREEKWDYRTDIFKNTNKKDGFEEQLLTIVNKIRDRVREPLLLLHENIGGKNNAKTKCRALFEFLCKIGLPQRIEKKTNIFKNEGELALVREYGSIWNSIIELLDRIVDIMGDERIGTERFHNILKTGFTEYSLGIIPPGLDQVLAGSVERSKSHGVKALYILGVNDGVFPALSGDEGILNDADRKTLTDYGIELAPDTRRRAFEEQYLVYTALTTPSEYLRISYPVADHEGRALRPSVIISEIKKIFTGVDEKSDITGLNNKEGAVDRITVPIPTFGEMTSSFRSFCDGRDLLPLWKDTYRWFYGKDDWKQNCMMIIDALKYGNNFERINKNSIKKLYGDSLYTSVSKLETYSACPFSFFLQYGLKAEERKEFSFTPPDIGSIMHKAIDMFSRRLVEKNISWRDIEKDFIEPEVSEIIRELVENMPKTILKSSKRYLYVLERIKKILVKSIWILAVHIKKSNFEPQGYEIVFGDEGKYPPIKLQTPAGMEILLTGRIDRLDIMKTQEADYIKILDYKSGFKDFSLSDIFSGLELQLVMYLNVIYNNNSDSEKNKNLVPAGILYYRIYDPLIKGEESLSEDNVKREVMRSLRTKGLVLEDAVIVRNMDSEIEGDSLIIPARINKNGKLGRSSAASVEQFKKLMEFVRVRVINMGEKIMNGDISIKPYRKKQNTACSYCKYSSICGFDPLLENNNYRVVKQYTDDEVWKKI